MTQVKEKRVVRSGMSLLLALVMLFSVVVAFPLDVSADVATERKLIKWHRVYTQADIKSGPMLLCWGGSGRRDYVSVGGYESGWSMVGTATANYSTTVGYGVREFFDEFYTFADEVTNYWTIEFLGKYDGANNGIKKCHLRLPRNPGEGGGYIWNEYKWHMFTDNEYNLQLGSGNPSDSDFDWSIATNGNYNYGRNTGYGYVQIFHEVGGRSDEELYGNGDKISCRGNSSYDYYDFVLYIGEEVTATEYSSFTVRSGQTFAMENLSILKERCTITIEPGAVLRVADTFINNGTIRNYGMYLIDENAVVSTFGTTKPDAGSVYNYGDKYTVNGITGQPLKGEGNMIVLGNAVYALTKDNASFHFKEGTSLHLNGLLTIRGGVTFSGAEVIIGNTGNLLVFYEYPERVSGDGYCLGFLKRKSAIAVNLQENGSPVIGPFSANDRMLPSYGKGIGESVLSRITLDNSQSYFRVEGNLYIYSLLRTNNLSADLQIAAKTMANKTGSVFETQGTGEARYVWAN